MTKRTIKICTASLGSLLLLASNAYAAQPEAAEPEPSYLNKDGTIKMPGGFSAEINGAQNFSYDSNPLRSATDKREIFGSTTSPELVLRRKTPTSIIESTSRVDANFYDRSEFNSVDVHEDLLLGRNNQRWTANLRSLFDYDTTRTSEITNYGVNKAGVHRTKYEVRPQVIFRSTERDSWSLNASASDSEYDDNSYTDYRYYSVSPSYEHRFDERNRGTIALNGNRYETTSGTSSSSDSFGPTIGWATVISPRLTLKANAGVMSTKKHDVAPGTDDSSLDYVFSATANYLDERDKFDFTATRARAPFGNGTESLVTTFQATERHHINKRLDVIGNAVYREADYESNQPGVNLDREYSAGAGIEYKVIDDVALTADYTYRNEKLTNTNGDVNQHIGMLGVKFEPSWSRK